jgi:hypothetical protein
VKLISELSEEGLGSNRAVAPMMMMMMMMTARHCSLPIVFGLTNGQLNILSMALSAGQSINQSMSSFACGRWEVSHTFDWV